MLVKDTPDEINEQSTTNPCACLMGYIVIYFSLMKMFVLVDDTTGLKITW